MVLSCFSVTVLAFTAAALVDPGCDTGECSDVSQVKPRAGIAMMQKQTVKPHATHEAKKTSEKDTSDEVHESIKKSELPRCTGSYLSLVPFWNSEIYYYEYHNYYVENCHNINPDVYDTEDLCDCPDGPHCAEKTCYQCGKCSDAPASVTYKEFEGRRCHPSGRRTGTWGDIGRFLDLVTKEDCQKACSEIPDCKYVVFKRVKNDQGLGKCTSFTSCDQKKKKGMEQYTILEKVEAEP